MPWKTARCAACQNEVPLPRLERLLWVVVCHDCARGLKGGGALETVRRAAAPFLFYSALAMVAHFAGPGVAAFLGGAAGADLLTWLVFGFITAIFDGAELLVLLAFRTAGLALILGPGLVLMPDGPELAPGAIGFFLVLLVKAGWLAASFDGLIDSDRHESDFDLLGKHPPVEIEDPDAPPAEPLQETRRAG